MPHALFRRGEMSLPPAEFMRLSVLCHQNCATHHSRIGGTTETRRIMHVPQLLRCAVGHHVPSHRRSHLVDGKKESVCRGCGRKIVKEDLAWPLLGAEDASTSVNLTKL